MSKKKRKKEVDAFREGMEAGAKPFGDKMEQHAKELKKSKKEILQQINEVGLVQDEVLDIVEEHDEAIKRVNEKVQYGLKDKESLGELEKGEKEVLGGLLVELSNQFDFNEGQKKFTANVLRILGISNPQNLSLDVIEDVEKINVQKVLYRVILEVFYLNHPGGGFSKEEEEVFEYFSISGRKKNNIREETEKFYKAVGDDGFINKYFVSEEEMQKKKKTTPKLEIDPDIWKYAEHAVMPYLSVEDSNDYMWDNFTRSYDEAEKRYEAIIKENYNNMMSYLKPGNSEYVGEEAADFYQGEITERINQIIDYVNVYRLHINLTELIEMRDDCRDEILEMADEAMEPQRMMNNSHILYAREKKIEKDVEFVDSFFGGGKEVTVYKPSYDAISQTVEEMMKDLQRAIEMFDTLLWMNVRNKYMFRIMEIVKMINVACGNDE